MKKYCIYIFFVLVLMVLNPLPNEPLNPVVEDPVIEDPVIEDPVIEIPHQNETEVVNTQKLDLVDQSITLDLQQFDKYAIMKFNNLYYMPDVVLNVIKIYTYTAAWASKTEVHSYTVDVNYDTDVKVCSALFYNNAGTDTLLFVFIGENDAHNNSKIYYVFYNTVAATFSDVASGAMGFVLSDITYLNTSPISYAAWPAASNKALVYTSVETIAGVCTRPAKYDNDNVRYMLYDGATYYLRNYKISTTTFSTISTPTLSGGTDLTFADSIFLIDNNIMYVGWKDTSWYYENSAWLEVNEVSGSYPAMGWYLDGYDIKGRSVAYSNIILLFKQKYFISINLSFSLSFLTAWDDYFIDTDKKVWKLEYVPMAVENDGHKLYEKYLAELDQVIVTSETSYIENQYMINADDADIEIFEGYIDKIIKEAESSVIIMEFRSEVRNELNQRITGTWTQMTPQAILADIILTNFKWLSGLVGVSLKNTITTLLDLAVTNLPFWKICQMFDDRFTYITHLNPNNVLYWDIGAAPVPAVTFVDTDELAGPDFQGNVIHAVYPIKFAIIELWGSVQDGLRTHCIYKSDGNYGKYEMSYPDLGGSVDPTTGLVTSGPLYDQVVGLSANKNQSLVTLRLSCFGKGRLKIGDIVVVTQSQFSITAKNFYVYGNIYDGTNDACVDLYLQSAIYPIPDLNGGVDEQSNEELILMNAKEINDVRNAILFVIGLYLTNTASAIVGTYKQFADATPVGNSTVNAVISSASGTLIEEWITETAPGVLDFAVGDIIEGHLFVYVNALVGNKTCLCYYEVYRRTAGGTETKFATSSAVFVTGLAATIQEVEIYCYVDTAMILADTDYLVIKTYGKITGTGSNPTLYISYGATYHSHFGVGIQNTHLSNNFLRLDGTKTMTGQIKSSLAIGTAPMVIVSTTTVANLSVDHTKASNIGALTHAQLDYLKYFCRLRKNQTQTISNATTTRIIWDTNDVEVEDTYDMHTPSGTGDSNANCRIYAPVAGLYEIQLKITFNTISASQVQAWIRINAETTGDRSYMGITSHNEAGGVTSHLNVVATIRLAANECIEGWVFQGSGGNGTIISIATMAYFPTAISVKWVGP